MKIDVEGFEIEVLLGAERVLAERRPSLIMEVQPSNRSAVMEILRRHAYRALDESGNPLASNWKKRGGGDLNLCCLPA